MTTEKLKPVRGIAGLFVSPRGLYVIKTSARSVKTGKMVYGKRTLPEGASRNEAIAALAAVKEDLRTGEPGARRASDVPTLRAYVPCWAESQIASGRWSTEGGTASAVGWRLDKYVIPRFGDYLLDQITYADLERWLAWMLTKVGTRTVRAAYSALRQAVKAGRKTHGLPPMVYPDLPREPRDGKAEPLTWENFDRKDGLALTREQLGRFLVAARAISPHGWYPMTVLGFGTGARFSELAACRVEDFDLRDDVGIWLCRRHLVDRVERAGVKWDRRGTVKLLDVETTRLLRPFLVDRTREAPLFPSDQGGVTYRTQKGMQWFLDAVSARTGLPRMTSKVFRRTYLTLSHLQTMADAMSQSQAGHTDALTTMTYVKPSLEHRREHARRMGQVLYVVDEPLEEPEAAEG